MTSPREDVLCGADDFLFDAEDFLCEAEDVLGGGGGVTLEGSSMDEAATPASQSKGGVDEVATQSNFD